jgi:hypothetical protein
MSQRLHLIVRDQNNNNHRINYQLADNPIASAWIKKIKHLSRVPLDPGYTASNVGGIIYSTTMDRNSANLTQTHQAISYELQALNQTLGHLHDVKTVYDQTDCNVLHALTISEQYRHSDASTRNMFHRLHRHIHQLEKLMFSHDGKNSIHVDWGEKAGPLTSTHTVSPYRYYELSMMAGCIYQQWAEFGKTPYRYWQDRDKEDKAHFFNNCLPHTTFRPGFDLFIRDQTQTIDPAFEQWFDRYRTAWHRKHDVPAMAAYGRGGVPLARPMEDTFSQYTKIHTVLSIQID